MVFSESPILSSVEAQKWMNHNNPSRWFSRATFAPVLWYASANASIPQLFVSSLLRNLAGPNYHWYPGWTNRQRNCIDFARIDILVPQLRTVVRYQLSQNLLFFDLKWKLDASNELDVVHLHWWGLFPRSLHTVSRVQFLSFHNFVALYPTGSFNNLKELGLLEEEANATTRSRSPGGSAEKRSAAGASFEPAWMPCYRFKS